jgi:hypothetical protein
VPIYSGSSFPEGYQPAWRLRLSRSTSLIFLNVGRAIPPVLPAFPFVCVVSWVGSSPYGYSACSFYSFYYCRLPYACSTCLIAVSALCFRRLSTVLLCGVVFVVYYSLFLLRRSRVGLGYKYLPFSAALDFSFLSNQHHHHRPAAAAVTATATGRHLAPFATPSCVPRMLYAADVSLAQW